MEILKESTYSNGTIRLIRMDCSDVYAVLLINSRGVILDSIMNICEGDTCDISMKMLKKAYESYRRKLRKEGGFLIK